jgi:starch synthase (maltosyl-transferring)
VVIGRIPVLDIQPVVACGQRPAKAVTGETLQVSATVFREGHEMLGAGVVLRDPEGNCRPIVTMRELAAGTDTYGADVSPTSEGLWHFRVEAWGDPIAHWRRDAAIKVPIGQDVSLMLEEGALLFERAAKELAASGALSSDDRGPSAAAARARYEKVARELRAGTAGGSGGSPPRASTAGGSGGSPPRASTAGGSGGSPPRPSTASPVDRLGTAFTAEVTDTLAAFPLREHTTRSEWYPLMVDRQRALFGSWYEFFPRSEGASVDPLGRRRSVSNRR